MTMSRLVLPEPDGPDEADRLTRRKGGVDAAENGDRPGRTGETEVNLRQDDSRFDGRLRPRWNEERGSMQHVQSGPAQGVLSRYGPVRRLINAAAGLVVIALSMTTARADDPVRLLVFGDSLTAGYGWPETRRFRQGCSRP